MHENEIPQLFTLSLFCGVAKYRRFKLYIFKDILTFGISNPEHPLQKSTSQAMLSNSFLIPSFFAIIKKSIQLQGYAFFVN